MHITEVHLRVKNLTKSIGFYSSLFGEECRRERSRALFSSGIVLVTEKEWKDEAGLPFEIKPGPSLSSTVILECDDLSRIISNILENGLLPHVFDIASGRVVISDYDFNILIIRKSGKEHALADDYRSDEKAHSQLSVRQ